jgi:tRNA(Ile)-lysidine synthase TilS/MesJ
MQIRTMKANYTIEAGDVNVIRPLIYVRETATRDFSTESRFPVINENCPACFEEPKVTFLGKYFSSNNLTDITFRRELESSGC